MPPFSLAALEASLVGRPGIPADDLQGIATQVYSRYENTGPAGTKWRPRQITLFKTTGGRYVAYDLCRADWAGGVYFSAAQRTVQALADALNELEGLGLVAEDGPGAQA